MSKNLTTDEFIGGVIAAQSETLREILTEWIDERDRETAAQALRDWVHGWSDEVSAVTMTADLKVEGLERANHIEAGGRMLECKPLCRMPYTLPVGPIERNPQIRKEPQARLAHYEPPGVYLPAKRVKPDTEQALRAQLSELAKNGVGADLKPTIPGDTPRSWSDYRAFADYLERVDRMWRDKIHSLIGEDLDD